jgi:hypothetical protein
MHNRRNVVRIPAGGFFSIQPSLVSTKPPVTLESWALSPEIKRAWHEADHSTASTTKITNEWSYTFTPPVHLRDIYRDNFNLVVPNI